MTAFRDLLAAAERPLVGTWVKLSTTASVDLLALAGFDFLVIDMEHAPLGTETVHELIGAAIGRGIPAMVRVPDRSPSTISRVLDSGASGVFVPHVDTVTDAKTAIGATRFPPHGTRGFGPTVRAGGWGSDPAGYRASGEVAFTVTQLESRDAIEAAAAIASLEGLGALFVGPVDLAVATDLDRDSPEFAELLAKAESAAREYGVPIGTAVGDVTSARRLGDRYDFVLVGNDAALLHGAGAAIVAAYAAL